MDSRSTPYITVAAVTVVAGLAAYAVYFDYKRRNDADFRKKIKKEKKRVEKVVAQTKQSELAASTSDITPAALREALKLVKSEPGPQSPDEKEQYFMTQVSIGEQLTAQGPQFYLPAATAFFRALRVYPAPVELIVIYEKTIIEPVFKLVMDLTQLDVKARIEAYYEYFPPKTTNVSITSREITPGQGNRQLLVVDRDFAAGDVIYKEFPVVAALDPDLQDKGTHCGQCLRPIATSPQNPTDSTPSPFHLTYCSTACMLNSKKQSHSLLFTLDPPLPSEIPAEPITQAALEARQEAQAKFAEFIKKEARINPLLVARFIARQVAGETQKLAQAAGAGAGLPTPSDGDFTDATKSDEVESYGLADHLERLRYLEVVSNQEEAALLTRVLSTALPGLEAFVTEEKYATMLGKIAYNAFGVCFEGGRDDRPVPTTRPEDVEKTRTPYGTQRQIGSAFYTLSSYLTHSCDPSARPYFGSGNTEISIIANRDLKKGDVLTIAFVDVTHHADETVIACRRRRRFELARGWRFSCGCERCAQEAESLSSDEKASVSEQHKDESRVEESVKNYPASQPPQDRGDVE